MSELGLEGLMGDGQIDKQGKWLVKGPRIELVGGQDTAYTVAWLNNPVS